MAKIYFYDATKLDKRQLKHYCANMQDVEIEFIPGSISLDNIHEDATVISVFVTSSVTKEMMQKLPHLKLIACRSTGYNNVDLHMAKSRGIAVTNVPSYGQATVAEYTFTLMLSLMRKLPIALESSHSAHTASELMGSDLSGKTLGIVGTGRIGQHVIVIAKAFGMEVLAYDPYPNNERAQELGYAYADLDSVVRQADVLTLHAPYSQENYHLINQDRLQLMKKTAILINTARGELVDTRALIDVLAAKKIAGAGLDVFEGEQLFQLHNEVTLLRNQKALQQDFSQSVFLLALQKLDNVIITPHNAFNTSEAIGRINETTCQNISGLLNGTLQNIIETSDALPGKLIIVRHAESEWNASGKWTGRRDVHLSRKGFHESALLGLELQDTNIDVAYCSEQMRTFETLQGILDVTGQLEVPIHHTAEINERDYGDYTGVNKWQMREKVGEEEFTAIRRGWDHHIPNGETLKDVYKRALPFYKETILPQIQDGNNVLIVAHGNSIRALTKYIERVSEGLIGEIEMMFGTVVIYSTDKDGYALHKENRQISSPPPNA